MPLLNCLATGLDPVCSWLGTVSTTWRSTRSLLNTAKVMAGNPVALRMKELETLERVAERMTRISMVGGLDQALNGLVTLRPNGA